MHFLNNQLVEVACESWDLGNEVHWAACIVQKDLPDYVIQM